MLTLTRAKITKVLMIMILAILLISLFLLYRPQYTSSTYQPYLPLHNSTRQFLCQCYLLNTSAQISHYPSYQISQAVTVSPSQLPPLKSLPSSIINIWKNMTEQVPMLISNETVSMPNPEGPSFYLKLWKFCELVVAYPFRYLIRVLTSSFSS